MASYGYKVLTKETAKASQNKTLIVKVNKQAKMPFTERFLTIRFGTVVTTSLPGDVLPASATTTPSNSTNPSTSTAPQPDYIIVLGANFRTPSGPTW
jgi:hypothetical protein